MKVKNNIIGPHLGRFLVVEWSDWADSFCIVSGFLRHKFRLPTKGILETKKFGLFLRYTPFEGTWKKIFRQKKYFPNWPYNIGNQIRWVRINFMTKRGEWDTLITIKPRKALFSGLTFLSGFLETHNFSISIHKFTLILSLAC